VGTEIERKFLVSGEDWRCSEPVFFCQGYLNHDRQRTVRVRIADDKAFLTIKGVNRGASRAEFEYEIPVADARQLIELCEQPLIEKYRHFVQVDQLTWEVDEFLGENRGLVIAEVELATEDQAITLPSWVGREVTDDPRYYNSNLSRNPYAGWSSDR
jgi:adenylate cyclase